MGLAFKENSPDIRNSGVARLVTTLESFNCNVDVYDPWVNDFDAQKEFSIKMLKQPESGKYDAIVISVAHDHFKELSLNEIKAYGASNHVLYDVKCIFSQSDVDGRL